MNWRLIPICLFFVPAMVGCQDASTSTAVEPQIGKAAPALEGTDATGKVIKLSDYRGKVVVIDFWATWCGPCKAMIPHEKKMVKNLEGRPFAFLAVSVDKKEDSGKLQAFLDKEKLPWPNIHDENDTLSKTWNVESLPTFFIIDTEGVIRHKIVGGGQDLEGPVKKLLAKAEGKSS